jgi:hypothetical protein
MKSHQVKMLNHATVSICDVFLKFSHSAWFSARGQPGCFVLRLYIVSSPSLAVVL